MTSVAVPSLASVNPVPAGLVEPLAEALRCLAIPRQRIEASFLEVGGSLIEANGLLSGITATFEALTARLQGAEGEDAFGAHEAFARRALAIAGSINRETQDLGVLIATVALIRRPIGELGRTIKSISLVAMAIRVCAAQLASGSTDFAVFTTDIMRLSERAMATIADFSVVYERLVATLKEADAKRAVRDHTNRTLSGLAERLEASLLAAALHRNRSIAASDKTGQLFGRISEGITSVITELQIGDITRQRIEHVEDGLQSLLAPAARVDDMPSGEDAGLIAAVCGLQSAQIEQAAQDFEQGAGRIIEIIRQVGSDAGDIVAQSRHIHEGMVEASTAALDDLTEEVRRAGALMHESEAARIQLDQASAAVNASLHELVRCAQSLQRIKGGMHILGINMGLKCAHLGAEGNALNVISHELRELAEKTVVHAQNAVEGLNEASTHARSLTATATETALGEIERLEEEVRRSATMPQTDRCLTEALDHLVRKGTMVADLLIHAAERTTFREDIGTMLRAGTAAINRVRAEAHTIHAATGTADSSLAEEAAFARLKSRYTMASERALHDQYSGLPSKGRPKQSDHPSTTEFDLDDIFL